VLEIQRVLMIFIFFKLCKRYVSSLESVQTSMFGLFRLHSARKKLGKS